MVDVIPDAVPAQAGAGAIGTILPADILRVGFGCAALLGPLSPGESERLLHAALDSGISYFDTARMYGSGEAESILGRLTPEHRHRMVLVSKAGIMPPSRAMPIRIARKVATLGLQALPDLQRKVLDAPPLGARLGVFDLPSLTASLDTSLRELRTDYLDILLLHEIEYAQANASILAWLRDMKRIGKIRSFGIASDFYDTVRLITDMPELAGIVQFASSAWDPNLSKLNYDPARLVVTHSCLGKRFHQLLGWLAARPEVAESWSKQLDIDARNSAALARLLLAEALDSNRQGIVLFSSGKASNIAMNAELARSPTSDTTQLAHLRKLVSELPSSTK
jgi:hypothetical protein